MEQLIPNLRQRLQQPLPGRAAHLQMVSENMQKARFQEIPSQHRLAGVMALLYQKNGEWHTALMQRPESKYAHSKQVSFPGGTHEDFDNSLMHTALRETEEEFGVGADSIDVLGKMTELYIPVSNFLVQPFVGYLAQAPVFQPDSNEVEEILETPLAWLLDNSRRLKKDLDIGNGIVLSQVPYFNFHDRVVWGATAMMLSELAAILK